MMSDGSFGSDGFNDLPSSAAPQAREETRAERIARETEGMRQEEVAMYRKVHDLVEGGNTSYDLSAMKLRDGDLCNLRLITTIIRAPLDAGVDVPAEGQYRSMIPRILLNLERNNLSSLEPTLFDLQHLTSLNLSVNQIKELPPQIAKLTNLETLNLCFNQLQWLPCEILAMFQPTSDNHLVLSQFGNPVDDLTCDTNMMRFYRSTSKNGFRAIYTQLDLQHNIALAYSLLSRHEDTKGLVWLIRSWETRLEDYKSPSHHRFCPSTPVTAWQDNSDLRTRFIGATPPSYFDTKGNMLPGSPVASTSEVIIKTHRGAWGMPVNLFTLPSKTRTPSLVNMTIQKLLEIATPAEIRQTAVEDLNRSIPQPIERLLRRAEGNFGGNADYNGLVECHVCGEPYLVPAAEWFEVWSPGKRHCVRIRVQVCSWACVPDEIAMQPQKVLDVDAMDE